MVTVVSAPAAVRDLGRRGRLELRHAGFRYPGAAEPVLADVSFTATAGQTTALIGSTGAGKTTLVSLIARLFDVTAGAVLINASQRSLADHSFAYDQSSWAVGTSYAFSPTSKLKAEYLRTHIGDMSTLVDAPSGSNIRNQNINVFSLSYNFVF
mgnify:CR=1 FL=1